MLVLYGAIARFSIKKWSVEQKQIQLTAGGCVSEACKIETVS